MGSESLKADLGLPRHIAPALGLAGDEGAELVGRVADRGDAEVGETRGHRRVGERRARLGVQALR